MPQPRSRIRWNDQSPAGPSQSQPSQRPTPAPSAASARPPDRVSSLLDQIGRDLTQLAREGRLKPLFGREKELLQLQRILLRKEKNNPLLIGAPGVGKTALVEGLANRIAAGGCIQDLQSLRIIEITPASLIAGTMVRGTLEAKLDELVREASQDAQLVLFIDEIHTLVRAGAVEGGSLDVATILKPALARGDIHCIGATTSDEFDKFLHADAAFERRFDPLVLQEPTESEAIEILRASLSAYEAHHKVRIEAEAIEAAVRLSSQHILDRRLPDKAFDLLDSACTFVRIPDSQDQPMTGPASTVTAEVIGLALAEQLSIPISKLNRDDRATLSGLEEFLRQRITGQPIAMTRVASALMNALSGLGKPNQPKQVFFFVGSTGVGKTATAKALAERLFDSPDALIRLDMSEYKEAHTVSRLLGSPPGYVGYDDEGTFATRLRRQPYSVVLLDEIEKAHPQVHDAFLQIFDEGRFTDTHGRIIDARNAIFILTSNLYTVAVIDSLEQYDQQVESIRRSLSGFFRPEFVNRIGEIVLYRELGENDLAAIAKTEIDGLNERLSKYRVTIRATDEAVLWISQHAYDPNSGARAVLRIVAREIAEPVSNLIVTGRVADGEAIKVVIRESKLSLEPGD